MTTATRLIAMSVNATDAGTRAYGVAGRITRLPSCFGDVTLYVMLDESVLAVTGEQLDATGCEAYGSLAVALDRYVYGI